MKNKSIAQVRAIGAVVTIVCFVIASALGSWAIDSGSWFAYCLTIFTAAFGLKILLETVKYGKK